MMRLTFCGLADVYAQGFQHDRDAFMESTHNARELVGEERMMVEEAFAKVIGCYAKVGSVRDPNLIGAGDDFRAVLEDAMARCEVKDVHAESSATMWFEMECPKN